MYSPKLVVDNEFQFQFCDITVTLLCLDEGNQQIKVKQEKMLVRFAFLVIHTCNIDTALKKLQKNE